VTKEGHTIVFNAVGGFFVQLAKLDSILEKLASAPGARARIDLSLGREVPVKLDGLAINRDSKSNPSKVANVPTFTPLLISQSKTKREL
jgi:hypothetical protein